MYTFTFIFSSKENFFSGGNRLNDSVWVYLKLEIGLTNLRIGFFKIELFSEFRVRSSFEFVDSLI
jgi:hypothetical protein